MKRITAAGLKCGEHQCDCHAMYTGPLDVGAQECNACHHALLSHRIVTQAAYAADPETGRMADDFEIAPSFR
jgi:hypothetical protein